MSTAPTEPAGAATTLRSIRDLLPRAAVLHLCRLALADGHTPDGATGVVVEHLVASGELGDSPQLRALVACWVGLIAAQRKPPVRRKVAASVASAEVEVELEVPLEQPPDTGEVQR